MIKIPEGVTVQVEGTTVTAKGPKGEVTKTFSPRVSIKKAEGGVEVSSKNHALEGTISSLINNMITGVTEGYSKNLKVLFAHFPISLEVKGQQIMIKNFLGEKKPRKTKLVGNTKVEVKGQNVTISGPDKEAVGQTAANLMSAVKIREKDGRIFQDGIYPPVGE